MKELADQYLFIRSDKPYNRSRAFNAGAVHMLLRDNDILCVMDADLLVDGDYVKRCIANMRGDAQAVLPYRFVKYMERFDTDTAQHDRLASGVLDFNDYHGQVSASQGGAFWLDYGLYRKMGGHDERFVGWGCEDSDFWFRLEEECSIRHAPGTMLHMWHPEAERGEAHARNRSLYESLHPDKVGSKRKVEPVGAEEVAV